MNFINFFYQLGVSDLFDEDVNNKIRVFNVMCWIGVLVVLVLLIASLILSLPYFFNILFLIILSALSIPFFLVATGYHIPARIVYILEANLSILLLPIFCGAELDFQYYFFVIVGMPLIFIPHSKRVIKYSLIFTTLSFFCIVEWYLHGHMALFDFPKDEVLNVRIINVMLVITAIFALLNSYIKQTEIHVRQILNSNIKIEKLEDLTRMVSHDLKSPLNSISTLVSFIKQDYEKDFDRTLKEMFGLIQSSSSHLTNLINAILTYAKVGQESKEITEFSLLSLLNEVIRLQNIPKHIRIELPTNDIEITGVKICLEQVLSNLISNAIKYNNKQSGIIQISFEKIVNNNLLIKISDNGQGIQAKYLPKVFDLFYTAHGTNRSDSTGVGLSIVKKIVENNNGEIGVNSEENIKTTFWFTWQINVHRNQTNYKKINPRMIDHHLN